MALENNVDLAADRLDPQISDTRVAAAAGAFRPTFQSSVQRNNQLQPPASFLIPTSTRTDVVTSNAGLSQRLPWFGTTYNVVVGHVAHRQQQLPEQLQPAAAFGAGDRTCRSRWCATCRSTRRGCSSSPAEDGPRHRRHAAAREHRAHDGGREDARTGTWSRRAPTSTRAPYGAQLAAGARARQQGEGGRRTVAAARSRVGPGRSGGQPGAADHRGDDRQQVGGPAAHADLRHHAAATSGTSASSRSTRRRSASAGIDVEAAVTQCPARPHGPRARAQGDRQRAAPVQ